MTIETNDDQQQFVYIENHNRTLNMNQIYDHMSAIMNVHNQGAATIEEAIKGIINLWLDELQDEGGDVMPNLRDKSKINASDLV